jgi:hypothetical protein
MKLPALLAVAMHGILLPGPQAGPLRSDRASEVQPQRPRGSLEDGMPPELALPYAAGLAAVRSGDYRTALSQVRRARALSYRLSVRGPLPRLLAHRYLVRTAYVEVQLTELVAIDEQLPRLTERVDDHASLLQLRAMILHNLFLAVRAYTGQSDARLLRVTVSAYEAALAEPGGHLRSGAQVSYAAILGERGELRAARSEFAKVGDKEVQSEELDLPVAYYYLAMGERGRALGRLVLAARRDSWDRPGALRDGTTVRAQAYRMNDFDRLRDHPRFAELVTQPEERRADGR